MKLKAVIAAGLLVEALAAATSGVLAEQGIFSLSHTPQTSTTLGATGVCAYVLEHRRKQRGFYITDVSQQGFWRLFGLKPGDLVLKIAKMDTPDAESVDKAIRQSIGPAKKILFVRPETNGTPKFITETTDVPDPKDQIGDGGAASLASASAPDEAQTSDTAFGADQGGDSIDALEQYAANLVNKDRQREGQRPIRVNNQLSKLARDYADYMMTHHFFAHVDEEGRTPATRAEEHGIQAGVYENLAYQTYGLGDERQMIDRCEAQMMSEPRGERNHRDNITSANHCCMGIGIARDRQRLIMVQEFTDSLP